VVTSGKLEYHNKTRNLSVGRGIAGLSRTPLYGPGYWRREIKNQKVFSCQSLKLRAQQHTQIPTLTSERAVQVCAQKSDFSLLISSAGPKEFFYRGHNYFFSGNHPQYRNTRVDWLDARNICREYCMDLVSMEGQEENNIVFRIIQQSELYTALFIRSIC